MNAGIFIWKAQSIQNAFKKYALRIHQLFEKGDKIYNTDKEADFIKENYSKSPNISIDYAILEKANNVYTTPADIDWYDLGLGSFHEVSEKDENNNALSVDYLYLEKTNNCIIHLPKGKDAVIKGLEDFIIVDDGKVLLIYPKAEEQEIKQLATGIVGAFGDEFS